MTSFILYTLLGVILYTLLLAIILLICIPLICLLIFEILRTQENYADAELYIYARGILKGTLSFKGISYYFITALIISLFLPNIILDEYKIDSNQPPSIMILYYEAADMLAGPQKATVYNKTETRDIYSDDWYYQKTYLTRYAKYEKDGVFHKTPCTKDFYEQLINADVEQINVDVLIYPHTGIIVDFQEKPLGLYEPEERLDVLKDRYGYPYELSIDERGLINLQKNTLYPEEISWKNTEVIDYENIYISYNNQLPYSESILKDTEKTDIEILYDGTYEIWLINNLGQRISEKLILTTKQETIVKVNDTPTNIPVFYVSMPAGYDEEYSEAMQQFIDHAEELGFDVDYLLYHYNKNDSGRYFFYKYLSAFHYESGDSIQIYECENETDALETYKS